MFQGQYTQWLVELWWCIWHRTCSSSGNNYQICIPVNSLPLKQIFGLATVPLLERRATRWAGLTRQQHGASCACSMVCVEEQADWQAEQSLLHTGLSELAWGCWLCNKAFNGHTASPRLPGATTKSLFTVTCPDVTDLFISLCRLVHPSSGCSTHKMLFFFVGCFSSPLYAASEGCRPQCCGNQLNRLWSWTKVKTTWRKRNGSK